LKKLSLKFDSNDASKRGQFVIHLKFPFKIGPSYLASNTNSSASQKELLD